MIFKSIEFKEGLGAILDETRKLGYVFAPGFQIITKVLQFFADGGRSIFGMAWFVPRCGHDFKEVRVVSPVALESKNLAFGDSCFNMYYTWGVI